jgi:hypothetical protein
MSLDTKTKHIECNSTDYTVVKYTYDLFAKLNCLVKYYSNNENIFEANEVMYGIYLGDINSVYDIKKLKEIGVTNIISVISGFIPPYPNDFNYLVINALDNTNTSLLTHFEETNCFIDDAFINNGKVLIHCQYGRSRSATILSAYIIKSFGMDVKNSLDIIKSKRDIIQPNQYFIEQLKEYYSSLYPHYLFKD